MNKDIYKIINYMNSSTKISKIVIYSNATIPIKETEYEIKVLQHPKVLFSITDYGNLSKNTERVVSALERFNINYKRRPPEYWTDSGTIHNFNRTVPELEELFEVISYGKNLELVRLDVTKIRGLSYYSGFLVETNLNFKAKNAKGKEIEIGSCASGGRYNNLIARFKGADYKGSGMSIGIDRLLYALNQLENIKVNTKQSVLICVLDQKYIQQYYKILNELRTNGIQSEIYLDKNKNLKKQLQYADRKNIELALIVGENEFNENKLVIKKLTSSKENDQIVINRNDLINEIKKLIWKYP